MSHESYHTHLYLTSFDYYRICDLQNSNYFAPPDGLTHWFGIQDAELTFRVSQQQVRRYHVSTVYREAKHDMT